ncbi:MAG: hypothetical protein M3Q30_26900 [Actinomycetota bacterium]|nr:hypothetical protein [Gemmatimonadota bacterium]MDP9336919.1 hypothetical protein [Actinomycetota bacterium]
MIPEQWTWPKQDDKLTPYDRFIRNVNVAMKKLENLIGVQQATIQAAGTFTDGATTPTIALASVWKTNNVSAPTTITNFLGGDSGKTFDLIAGDGNTTIQHDATKIKTKTGANRVLANGNTTRFVTHTGAIWQEVPTP